MMELSCHCGSVRIRLASRPDYLNACNCSLCRKAGAQWGYFPPSEVTCSGATRTYTRPDRSPANVALHFCPECGSTTHCTLTTEAEARVGQAVVIVNMALAAETELAGIELRFPDGKNWAGSGDFTYVRPPEIIGARASTPGS
ncbi:MAG: GFA family protein [Proteobacteria bacterium]|nr:GFA family protein [Pseudomonadota bacterium]